MLSGYEREQLLERQARVYEVADIATKPAQWLIGGLKLLLLVLIVAGVVIGTPIYVWLHGGTVSGSQLYNALLALAGIVLFFAAPYYVVCGGTLFAFVWGWWLFDHPDQTFFKSPANVLLGFELVGYAWVAFRVGVKRHLNE